MISYAEALRLCYGIATAMEYLHTRVRAPTHGESLRG
jgi:hypothetical protein